MSETTSPFGRTLHRALRLGRGKADCGDIYTPRVSAASEFSYVMALAMKENREKLVSAIVSSSPLLEFLHGREDAAAGGRPIELPILYRKKGLLS